jgi:hypothetical protein
MERCDRRRKWIFGLAALLLGLPTAPAAAQVQCGTVAALQAPVPADWRIVQAYGAPSPRHQGRFHTGEDWAGARGQTYGQPVRAIAAGRVTYSAPNGWGRDGGVVIIEHTFADGAVYYSQYGHLMETVEAPFPARYGCVEAGQIIGAVQDVRPAPHLHFEIRENQPDVPGPGYTWEAPRALGFLHPSRFLVNQRARLNAAWLLELPQPPVSAPAQLADNSLIYADSSRLRRVSADGRVLWRANLERAPAAVMPYLNGALLIYPDGAAQPFALDGTPGEGWTLPIAPLGAALANASGGLIFATGDGRTVAWQLRDRQVYTRAYAARNVVALLSENNELALLAPDGRLLRRARLRAGAALAAGPDGDLLAYTEGGLWRINGAGSWSLLLAETPPGGSDAAVTRASDGRVFLLTPGETPLLAAYAADGALLWQLALPQRFAAPELAVVERALLLTGGDGQMAALPLTGGGWCAEPVRVWGDGRTRLWWSLAGGQLRTATVSQLSGWNWPSLAAACR